MKEKVENYTSYVIVGLVMTVLVIAGLALYSFRETTRLASAAEEFSQERVARGEEIFAAQCSTCHGAEGQGGSGPALKNRTILQNTLDNVFFSVIRSGVPGTQMPAWSVEFGGPLTDEDVHDLVALLRSWEPTAPEIVVQAAPPSATNGALLFASTCAACHGQDGVGEATAPRLNDPQRLQLLPDEWYRAVIRNGRPAKGMPTWGTVLSPAQIEDLVALVAAWRGGELVKPVFSITDLLDQALFALDEGNLEDGALQVERARAIASGAGLQVLENARVLIAAGDLPGATAALKALQAEWPLGDPAAGAVVYSANCAACHGAQGEGGLGTALQNNVFVQSQTNRQMVEFLLAGRAGTAMAGFFDRLDENQLANVISILRLWQNLP